MKVMSIDASTKSTGIAIFENGQLKFWDNIIYNNTNTFQRIVNMRDDILNIYKQYKPDRVIIEDILPKDVKNNQKVYNALHYLQAAIVLSLYEYNKQECEFFVSSEWRRLAGIHTGRGIKRETLKNKSKELIKNKYGLDVNDDISDAICIGIAYINKEEMGDFS